MAAQVVPVETRDGVQHQMFCGRCWAESVPTTRDEAEKARVAHGNCTPK